MQRTTQETGLVTIQTTSLIPSSHTVYLGVVDEAVRYKLNYSVNGGADWIGVPVLRASLLTAQSCTADIEDVPDGVAVLHKVRTYDGVGNVMVFPTELTTTDKSAFTWKWSAGMPDLELGRITAGWKMNAMTKKFGKSHYGMGEGEIASIVIRGFSRACSMSLKDESIQWRISPNCEVICHATA